MSFDAFLEQQQDLESQLLERYIEAFNQEPPEFNDAMIWTYGTFVDALRQSLDEGKPIEVIITPEGVKL